MWTKCVLLVFCPHYPSLSSLTLVSQTAGSKRCVTDRTGEGQKPSHLLPGYNSSVYIYSHRLWHFWWPFDCYPTINTFSSLIRANKETGSKTTTTWEEPNARLCQAQRIDAALGMSNSFYWVDSSSQTTTMAAPDGWNVEISLSEHLPVQYIT